MDVYGFCGAKLEGKDTEFLNSLADPFSTPFHSSCRMYIMITNYIFPFGEPVSTVEQVDKTPKKVFVLGVYASAVHARWIGVDNKVIVNAMAVASEPYIFWRGDNSDEIISTIKIPHGAGRLIPAARNLNGPSGNALDDLFLSPIGATRDSAWLCDLVPHSCCNPSQKGAIEREYEPLMKQHSLPQVTLPPVPKILADQARRAEILSEMKIAKPEIIMLLGNEPIKWFMNHYDNTWSTLSDFGDTSETYGKLHDTQIDGHNYKILALCHPRQAAKLGSHSAKWNTLHTQWVNGDHQ